MVKRLFVISIFSTLSLFLIQCSENSERKELSRLLESEFNIRLDKNITRIFILNDAKCSSCVYTFSEYIKENINDSKSLIVVQSRGYNIDIDGFIEKQKVNPNVLISQKINNENKYLSSLSVIYLNKNDIDTIINIIPGKINEQIKYIDMLESLH